MKAVNWCMLYLLMHLQWNISYQCTQVQPYNVKNKNVVISKYLHKNNQGVLPANVAEMNVTYTNSMCCNIPSFNYG